MEVGWISNRRLNDFHYKNKILWNSGDKIPPWRYSMEVRWISNGRLSDCRHGDRIPWSCGGKMNL